MAKKKTSLQKITSVFQNECARSIVHDNTDACNVNMPSGLSNGNGRKSPGSFVESLEFDHHDGTLPVVEGWLSTAHAEIVNFNLLAKSLVSNEIKFDPELEEYAATPKDVIIQLNKLLKSVSRLEKAAARLKKKKNQNKRKNNGRKSKRK